MESDSHWSMGRMNESLPQEGRRTGNAFLQWTPRVETFSPAMNNLWRWNFSTYTRCVTMKEKGTSDRHCSEQMGFWETTNKQTAPCGITASWELKEAAPTTISINCDPELDLKFHGWGEYWQYFFAFIIKLSLFYFIFLFALFDWEGGGSISHSIKINNNRVPASGSFWILRECLTWLFLKHGKCLSLFIFKNFWICL